MFGLESFGSATTLDGIDRPRHDNSDGHPSWTRVPEVTLLGDAAHLGATNGEGVEIAIGNHQADEDTAAVDRAIVAYEADMRAHR
ncbi:hypothetical protein AAWM_03005 [Aspergillus awamori]|uniref:Uncharacterized protein n=1 Tax=Aspergillus awamori TaxID=105351 RepID=A0A401KL33_ASPAW|nr:hypothetical protein AAWM_03005 [Aspergillus awamori]